MTSLAGLGRASRSFKRKRIALQGPWFSVPKNERRRVSLGIPQGMVIDIGSTWDLRTGDVIYVEGLGLLASIKYGNDEAFTVIGTDSSTGKVGVVAENGDQYWFDAGAKADLLAKLDDIAGYKHVTIYRPQGTIPVPQPQGQGTQGSIWNLIEAAKKVPPPSGYGPIYIGMFYQLELFDYVVSLINGVVRRYYVSKIEGEFPIGTVRLTLVASTPSSEPLETDYWFPMQAVFDWVTVGAFRAGAVMPDKPAEIPVVSGRGILPQMSISEGIGGSILPILGFAAVAAGALWLLGSD